MALNNSQFAAVMREYERQQSDNRYDYEKRINEVYEAIPGMRELNMQAGASAVERYRRLMNNNEENALADFPEEIEKIRIQKASLLREHGFAEDYMDMRYACNDCKDTGFIDGEKCHCFKQKAVKLLYERSNIDRILERENFANFTYEYFDNTRVISRINMTAAEYMKKVVELCMEYVEGFAKDRGSILFTGNTGVGKSFLSHCIAKELIDRYFSVIYLTAGELFDMLGRAKLEKDEKLQDIGDYIEECDLLIIDDLGTELTNSFTASELFHIVNGRLARKQGTIISTNLSMGIIRDLYSERVSSRLSSSYTVIPLYGDDIRLKL